MKLKINEELRKHIWPLRPEEFELLESNILKDGIMDSIKVWDEEPKDFKCYSHDETKCDIKFGDDVWECEYCGYGVAPIEHTIIDGHNRYEIAKKHNLSYDIEYLDFDTIEEAMNWMDANQSGRRNLTKDQWEISIGRQYNREKKSMSEAGSMKGKASADFAQASTADKLATENNVSPRTVKNYGKKAEEYERLEKEAPDLYEGINNREITFKDIKKEQKKQEKREKFIHKKNEFDKESSPTMADSYCYNGSCLEYLQGDSIDKIDLLLTDPPYAMDFKSGWNDWDKIEGDKREDTINLLDACFSLCQQKMKDNAHVYIFGNPNEIEHVKPIFERYFKLKNILIWDREVIGMGDLKTYGRSYDIIYFGYNKEWKDLNGTRDRDILEHKRVSPNELVHPTEKPEDILKYLIKKSTNEGDIVFDPFAGSCSTIRSAFELNRNAYGCELELKYIPEWMLKKI